MELGNVGVWSSELRYGDPAEAVDAVVEVEALGYGTAWLPDMGGELFDDVDRLLGATSTLAIATGVLNVWMHAADDVAAWWRGLPAEHANRVMLGIGVSHAPFIGDAWKRPLDTIGEYLDALDAAGLPQSSRCLAALGPRMLELAAARSAGTLTYLVPPEHTALARAAVGDGGVYVEQGVVLETDPDVARGIARGMLELYCGLPNYVRNWKRLGITDDDVADRSDRLVDTIVAWGDHEAIEARIQAHRDAGADHVCVQVLTAEGASPLPGWRSLGAVLRR